ncbi:MAG: replicative DNA helicase [Alphaproteobacteria bacterium]|nr:replicative DNA helicase [Alphaproteobacteria bacterium]
MKNPTKETHKDAVKFSNIEAEKSLLGFLIISNNFFEEISEIIFEDVFFLKKHQQIFNIIKTLLDKSQVADIVTISNFSSYAPEYKDITFDYLLDLTNSIVSTGGHKDYANLLYDLYIKRQILELQNNISDYLQEDDESANQISKIERDIFSLAEKGSISKDSMDFGSSLELALNAAKIASQYKNGISGVTTGLRDLDNKLGGLQRSDLIVLAGRPSMGKTALATNIAYNAAETFSKKGNPGAPVVVFSLEMSAEQIASRILSSEVGVSSDALRKGILSDSDFERLAAAVQTLKNIPIFIDDTASLTTTMLRTKCRRLKRQHGIGLIVIDYIQLLRVDRRIDSRTNEVSEITRSLKAIAKELDVPIIALSQLSRAVETRDDKKPMLSDLRESGSIEQDADVVSFIFREEYYLQREEPQMRKSDENEDAFKKRYENWQQRLNTAKNKATVIIAKNRHGAIGNVDLQFNAVRTQFVDLDKFHDPR